MVRFGEMLIAQFRILSRGKSGESGGSLHSDENSELSNQHFPPNPPGAGVPSEEIGKFYGALPRLSNR
jgi:hypothetical protein